MVQVSLAIVIRVHIVITQHPPIIKLALKEKDYNITQVPNSKNQQTVLKSMVL